MTEHIPPAVDDRRLATLEDELGDPIVVREAVRSFLAELPARLGAIRAAIEAGDPDATRDRAHALGSPAAMLGATSVRVVTKQLEAAVRPSAPEADLDELIRTLDAVCRSTADELRHYLATPLPA
jgi:HPt (histidine-containing phosphotransfer) domain-containing protein